MTDYRIDGHKLLWHLDRVAEWQRRRTITPIYVEVSPVAYCNHKCLFCGIDFAQARAVLLPVAGFARALGAMGKAGVRSIMYAGEGEPLLHRNFAELVARTRECGIDVALTTNGMLGSEAVWRELLPAMTWVKFSVDAGSADVYAQVHGVARSAFDKTLASIAAAVAERQRTALKTTIGVQFVALDANFGDLENAIERFAPMGVDYFVIKPFSRHPQMLAPIDVAYPPERIDWLREVTRKHQKRTAMRVLLREEAMERYQQRSFQFQHCRALPFWGYITARGDFYTCSVFLGDPRFRAGNVLSDDVEEILFGKARSDSIHFGEHGLQLGRECRLNCRMARANEFLEVVANEPDHVNFI
ncbi:MAG: radical SAM protein [Candidatus Schekmanbacteria bacterium]|nr:radical SAM protein [Candidatus Schekmanbacteria bacterium]